MKNVLIDKNCEYLEQEKYRELLEKYDEKFLVGRDFKQRSYDENIGSFCKDKNCDLLTADTKAYIHFFKNKNIKRVTLSEFYYEKKSDRHVYLVEIMG